MQDLNDLYYFAQSLEHGGFAAASRALGIPKSKLSRRVAELEARLGVRLIHRSTRRFQATEIGEVYYRHCLAMLVEAQAAQDTIEAAQTEPCGIVKLSCPTALLQFHVADMLSAYMARYPQVRIELEASNRRVDVVAEGFDFAIRVRPPPLQDSDLVLRVLSDRGQCLVASPDLITRCPALEQPQDLSHWPSLALGRPNEAHEWQLFKPEGEQVALRHHPRLMTTDMGTLHTAACAGLGIVQLPHAMVQEDLVQKRLVQLLPQWQLKREIIHLVFPTRRGLLPSVRGLIEHLAQAYAEFDEY
ncbi:MAG: LysR family transcriptional regulator [Oceanococcus sp.]